MRRFPAQKSFRYWIRQRFASEWVDAVVSYDTGKIKSSTKSFTMGDSSHKLVFQIKNDSVVITELHVNSDEVQPDTEPTDSPSEE